MSTWNTYKCIIWYMILIIWSRIGFGFHHVIYMCHLCYHGDSVNPNLGNNDAFLLPSLLGTRSMNLVIGLVWFLLLKWHWCLTQNPTPALKMAKTLPLHDDSLVSFFNFWILNWRAFQLHDFVFSMLSS